MKEFAVPDSVEDFYEGARLRAARKGTQIIEDKPTEIKDSSQCMSVKELAGLTSLRYSHTAVNGYEVGYRGLSGYEIVEDCENALGIAKGTLLRDCTPIRKEDLNTVNDTEETGYGLKYIGEGVTERPDLVQLKIRREIEKSRASHLKLQIRHGAYFY